MSRRNDENDENEGKRTQKKKISYVVFCSDHRLFSVPQQQGLRLPPTCSCPSHPEQPLLFCLTRIILIIHKTAVYVLINRSLTQVAFISYPFSERSLPTHSLTHSLINPDDPRVHSQARRQQFPPELSIILSPC